MQLPARQPSRFSFVRFEKQRNVTSSSTILHQQFGRRENVDLAINIKANLERAYIIE